MLLNKFYSKFNSTMNIKKNNIYKSSEPSSVIIASELLKAGSVIALPTDTVYGLACNANDPDAIQKLYKIKGREEKKPVAICVADFKHLKYWGDANHLSYNLLNLILPGPVTIVVNKSANLNNPYLNPGVKEIAIRIPDFNFIREVSREFQFPLALTSANKSSEKSTLEINEFSNLWHKLDAVFDGGQLGLSEEQRAASTVINLSKIGYFKIIRKGIALNHTIDVMKKFNICEL